MRQADDLIDSGETVLPPLMKNITILTAGLFKRWGIDFALKYILNARRLFENLNGGRIMGKLEFEQFLKHRTESINEFAQKWQAAGIDALISPLTPTSMGLKATSEDKMGIMVGYCSIWNITGFPAGTMPVTTVQPDEEAYTDGYNDSWTKAIQEDLKGSTGLPVSIQVVSYNFEDEKVLGLMSKLEKKIDFKLEMPKQLSKKSV